jgi:N-acetylglucosamine-6-phosphate deacetylase
VLEPGWLHIDGERIAAVGGGAPPGEAAALDGRRIVPGFVDVHVHGGGGASYTTGDLVVLDDDFAVSAVMARGAWVEQAAATPAR